MLVAFTAEGVTAKVNTQAGRDISCRSNAKRVCLGGDLSAAFLANALQHREILNKSLMFMVKM